VRPPDGERFLLCQVSWLQYLASGALMVGVYVLPGAPQTVAARQKGLGFSPSEKYSPAFLLPAMPSLEQEPTVVLPKGWFHRGRVIEIHTDRRFEVKLIDVEPGADPIASGTRTIRRMLVPRGAPESGLVMHFAWFAADSAAARCRVSTCLTIANLSPSRPIFERLAVDTVKRSSADMVAAMPIPESFTENGAASGATVQSSLMSHLPA
jgi:hypothetical protein